MNEWKIEWNVYVEWIYGIELRVEWNKWMSAKLNGMNICNGINSGMERTNEWLKNWMEWIYRMELRVEWNEWTNERAKIEWNGIKSGMERMNEWVKNWMEWIYRMELRVEWNEWTNERAKLNGIKSGMERTNEWVKLNGTNDWNGTNERMECIMKHGRTIWIRNIMRINALSEKHPLCTLIIWRPKDFQT